MNGRQITAIGTTPTLAEIFVGSLLFSTVQEAQEVLTHVEDSDVDGSAATVLSTIRRLVTQGVAPGPQLVTDELRRTGKLTKAVGTWLASATTSGACSAAARNYAAAVVAESFRRQAESFGNALSNTAWSGAESDVKGLVVQASHRIESIADRLAKLRGLGNE